MSLAEIEALPIQDIAAPDAHLFLWFTHRHPHDALHLVASWGFEYSCPLTWVKGRGMTPYSFMYTTEHVMFARRGSLKLLRRGQPTDFHAAPREPSRKPDEFYDLVREVSQAPRIDLFAREPHEGFDTWGAETDKFTAGRGAPCEKSRGVSPAYSESSSEHRETPEHD